MSIFRKLCIWFLSCGEDEHDSVSYNQRPTQPQPSFRHPDHGLGTSYRNPLLPPTSSLKPPPVLPPSRPSSSPSKPPTPQSSFVDQCSTFPKPPPSPSKVQQSSSVDRYSAFPKPPTSSSSSPNPPKAFSTPPQSSHISTSSSSPQLPASVSNLLQCSPVNPCPTFPKHPTSSPMLPQPTFVNPSPSSPKPLRSSKPSQSSSINTCSSSSTFPTSLSQAQKPSSVNPYAASPKPPQSSSNQLLQSASVPLIPSPKSSKQPQTSSKAHSSSPKPLTSASNPSAFSSKLHPTFKQVLSPVSSNSLNQRKKNYVWVAKSSLPIYAIPEDIKDLIGNDTVPGVLNQILSPTTYKDYFAALLYAEEFYHEKWPHFNVKNVTLAIHEASVHKNPEEEEKTFVEFEMASFPEDRPFLLSRDFVYVRPSGTKFEHSKGIIYRIVRSSTILVEFEDDFYLDHHPSQEYDVSFSFNRVCLKRAHQAVKTASDALYRNFLFPDGTSRTSIPTAPVLLSPCHKLDCNQLSAVRQILSIKGSPPYLVSGTSRTGQVVSEAVYQLCQVSLENKILICAPSNRCCDGLMRSLLKGIPESDMFRANAAFREKDEVPEDIFRSCLYEDPYFSCPPIEELQKFRVIFSTFISSFRLHDKGLHAGHFSHIFLVDASSAIEPETLVALTNFADEDTTVIVIGAPGNRPYWVRSDIARENGLKLSYFERLFNSMPYIGHNPMFITQLD